MVADLKVAEGYAGRADQQVPLDTSAMSKSVADKASPERVLKVFGASIHPHADLRCEFEQTLAMAWQAFHAKRILLQTPGSTRSKLSTLHLRIFSRHGVEGRATPLYGVGVVAHHCDTSADDAQSRAWFSAREHRLAPSPRGVHPELGCCDCSVMWLWPVGGRCGAVVRMQV